MPLIATRGAASAQGFGEFAQSAAPVYIEDVFSTYLYTGNGSSQTITNGIDLSGKGGMVWIKTRSVSDSNYLFDTSRGTGYYLSTNTANTQGGGGGSTTLNAFNSNGFSLGSANGFNGSGETLASWSFREQPKFFDVVTYTGTGSPRTVAHNLGSTPGLIIVKRLNLADAWQVYHRSLGATKFLFFGTSAAQTDSTVWNNTEPTSTVFTVGTEGRVNANGGTYVAYLFAHNAGGFGLTGSDNVISCGSFTTDGSGNATVNLGYEPQYILMKKTSGVQNWVCYDIMRGWAQLQQAQLYPNITQAEDMYTGSPYFFPTATGFSLSGTFGLGNNDTFVYITIRRGPMKTPEAGTEVFSPVAYNASTFAVQNFTNVIDSLWTQSRANGTAGAAQPLIYDRLRGFGTGLQTPSTAAETSVGSFSNPLININNYQTSALINGAGSGNTKIGWNFRRAPGFFDEVCYTGSNSTNLRVTHNLGVAPELIIVKSRGSTTSWPVYVSSEGRSKYMLLNSTLASTAYTNAWGTSNPTTTDFGISTTDFGGGFQSGGQVAYLFATCAGVSKVGSYTGTGALQTVNCGFTSGARFVLIKRTDSTGDWWVYDSARGISSGNDPYLFLNSTAAEVTNTNYVDTTSVGFQVTAAAPAGLNANGGTYIFLAIA